MVILWGVVTLLMKGTAAQSSAQETTITGKDLYRLNCVSCHGLNREGNLPRYPPLAEIATRMEKSEVRNQMEKGKGRMPSFPHLSEKEKEAIQ